MNLSYTNAPFLSDKDNNINKEIRLEKYRFIKKDLTHLLSEMNHYFTLYEEKVNKKLYEIKKQLTSSLLTKNKKDIRKYSKSFIFSENELQLIKNFNLSKENINDIFSINVYSNIIDNENQIINSNEILLKIKKFEHWVNLTKKKELIFLWEGIIERTIQNIFNH
jgi:hypothetical protein